MKRFTAAGSVRKRDDSFEPCDGGGEPRESIRHPEQPDEPRLDRTSRRPYGEPASPYGQPPHHVPGYGQPAASAGQQPPYAPQPPYGQYGPPPVRAGAGGTNVLAILSLVFAFVFAPAGIVLGHVAKRQIRQTGEEGDRLATGA